MIRHHLLVMSAFIWFDFIANSMAAEEANLPGNIPDIQTSGIRTQGKRGQNQSVGLRDQTISYLLDSTRTFNIYLIMTIIPSMIK